jgi:hypothetical protein
LCLNKNSLYEKAIFVGAGYSDGALFTPQNAKWYCGTSFELHARERPPDHDSQEATLLRILPEPHERIVRQLELEHEDPVVLDETDQPLLERGLPPADGQLVLGGNLGTSWIFGRPSAADVILTVHSLAVPPNAEVVQRDHRSVGHAAVIAPDSEQVVKESFPPPIARKALETAHLDILNSCHGGSCYL